MALSWLTYGATAPILSDAIGVGKAANERIVAAATLVLVANDGEISVRDFLAEHKAALSHRKAGDSSIYKHVASANKAFREHGFTLENLLRKSNDQNPEAAFDAVARYLFDGAHGRGKYRSVNDMNERLAKPRAEKTADELMDARTASMVKALSDPGIKWHLDQLQRIMAACDARGAQVAGMAEALAEALPIAETETETVELAQAA